MYDMYEVSAEVGGPGRVACWYELCYDCHFVWLA
jgi:hypothetical protein